jgi:hypothetical protein
MSSTVILSTFSQEGNIVSCSVTECWLNSVKVTVTANRFLASFTDLNLPNLVYVTTLAEHLVGAYQSKKKTPCSNSIVTSENMAFMQLCPHTHASPQNLPP